MGAGVEPGIAAPELRDVKRSLLQIGSVDVGDLELAARGRPKRRGNFDHVAIVEIEAGDGPVRLRRPRLFLDRQRAAVSRIERDDAVSLRGLYRIDEYRRTAFARCGAPHRSVETDAKK